VGTGQARRPACYVIGESNEFDSELDGDIERGETLAQDLLGPRLRQQDRERKGAIDAVTDRKLRELPGTIADLYGVEPFARCQELVDDAHALQRLEAPAPYDESLRDGGGLRQTVDDAHRHAEAAQRNGE